MNALTVDIQRVVSGQDLPGDTELSHWAAIAWRQDEPSEVTLRIVDREESARLNSLYRHKTGATNVLSFPFEAPPGIALPLAGDLVICAPVVERQAQEQGKPVRAHWTHMVVHGVLHLLGHDHEQAGEAEIMEALEVSILAELGHGDPYREPDTSVRGQ